MSQDAILKRKRITVSDYHRMVEVGILAPDERIELIHGELIEMSPSGPLHNSIITRMHRFLQKKLGDRILIFAQSPISISTHSEPEPDLAIVQWQADFYAAKHPEPKDIHWLVEVSDTSLTKDEVVKAPLYASAGIPVLWMVNIPSHQLEVFVRPSELGYQQHQVFQVTDQIQLPNSGIVVPIMELIGPKPE